MKSRHFRINRHATTWLRLGWGVGLLLLVTSVSVAPAAAASSQSFRPGTPTPQIGMLVSLGSDNQSVSPTIPASARSLVGVVVPTSADLNEPAGYISVQTDGVTNTLVSTLNGDVKVGTPITVSSLQGIGAKLTAPNGWIVGLAQASLSATTKGAVKTTVTVSGGGSRQVYVASIPVAVKVSYYAASQANGAASNTAAPQALQRIADALAHKHVSTAALYLSFAIFIIGLITSFLITNSTIRSAFNGLARQPLSRARIMRAEMSSLAIAAGVLVFSIIAGLLLLRLL